MNYTPSTYPTYHRKQQKTQRGGVESKEPPIDVVVSDIDEVVVPTKETIFPTYLKPYMTEEMFNEGTYTENSEFKSFLLQIEGFEKTLLGIKKT